jgi:nucleotide-binding universal stress UspA family protein
MSTHPPIVVGTDLSAAADEAVAQALAWATRRQAPLLVVHVASERVRAQLEGPKVEAALRARLGAMGTDRFDVLLRAGSAHAELIAVADERRAQLLVVGASGSSALERTLFGSTAEQAVRYAHCPVLVARSSPEAGPVVAASDFSEGALPALQAAAAESVRRGARLVLLHSVHEPPPPLALLGPLVISPPMPAEAEIEALDVAARETLATLLEGTGVPGDVLVRHEAPATAIVQTAEASGASLVVVGTRGRTGLARMALGSVAEGVVRRAPCSVLAVRAS